jgi:Ca2+-binding RTX toxin-like protein
MTNRLQKLKPTNHDTLIGFEGNDKIYGEEGEDRLFGASTPRAAQTFGVGYGSRSVVKRERYLTPIGLRWCANQRSNLNRALLARPSGDCLAA